jgi:hypothetical protein
MPFFDRRFSTAVFQPPFFNRRFSTAVFQRCFSRLLRTALKNGFEEQL